MKSKQKTVKLKCLCKIGHCLSQFKDSNLKIDFVSLSDVKKYHLYLKPKKTKKREEIEKLPTFFAKNDILLPRTKEGASSGKIAIIKNLKYKTGLGSSLFWILRPNKNVMSEWIYFCLAHPQFKLQILKNNRGSIIKYISAPFLRSYNIPFFSLTKQKRIVNKTIKEIETIRNTEKFLRKLKFIKKREIKSFFI